MELQITGTTIINFDEIKKHLSKEMDKFTSLVFTEETIKEAKSSRAELNKLFSAFETKRKEVKKECMKPYDIFEAKLKELTSLINEPINQIDTEIKKYEEIQKEEKLKKIKELYNLYFIDIKEINFDNVVKEQYLNATYKIKDIEKEFADLSVKIITDFNILNNLNTKFIAQIQSYYIYNNFDLSKAMVENTRLIDNEKRFNDNKEIKEKEEYQEIDMEDKEQEVKDYLFKISATEEDFNILKIFLTNAKISYVPMTIEGEIL